MPRPLRRDRRSSLLSPGRPPAARRAEEFAFHHEDVMGTSLELRVSADSREAAVPRRGPRPRARSTGSRPSSAGTTRQRVPPLASAPRRAGRRSRPSCSTSCEPCDRWRERDRRRVRPQGRGALPALVACAAAGRDADAERDRRGHGSMAGRRLAARRRGGDRRAALGLPADPRRDRQGVHRRPGLRGRRSTPARGVRGLLLNVGGDLRRLRRDGRGRSAVADPRHDSESSEPLARFEVRDRAVATSGSSQRGFRIDGRWYSHIFDPRTGRPRRADASARRSSPPTRPTPTPWRRPSTCCARRVPPPGRVAAGRRLPDRRRRRPGHAERRLARYERPAPRARPGRRPADRPTPQARPGATNTSWSSTSRSTAPRPRRAGTAALTWPSGSRTRTGSRSGTCRSGSRSAVPGRSSGSPT